MAKTIYVQIKKEIIYDIKDISQSISDPNPLKLLEKYKREDKHMQEYETIAYILKKAGCLIGDPISISDEHTMIMFSPHT